VNNKEICQIFEKLSRLYPNDKTFTRPKEEITGTIVLWQEALADVTLDCANRFLTDHVRRSQYMPAICDFYQFHKQELIDKRMRIESVQEEFIGDNRNVLLETARKMYEQGLITNPFKKKAQEKTEGEAKQS
jgi:hypothetical protein